MIRYHARWVLPISAPPIRDGTVVELGGRIVYVGPRDGAPGGTDRDLGDCALVPGLINAHTHLELTVFRGLLEELSFREWIARLQGAKMAVMTPERFLDSARWGIAEGVRAGITTFADTCDSGVVLEAMRERGVRGIMYQEVFSPSADPAAVREAAARLAEKLARHDALETELQQVGVSPRPTRFPIRSSRWSRAPGAASRCISPKVRPSSASCARAKARSRMRCARVASP